MNGLARLIGAAVSIVIASYAAAADIITREHTSNDTLLTPRRLRVRGRQDAEPERRYRQRRVPRAERSAERDLDAWRSRAEFRLRREPRTFPASTPASCGEVKNGRVYPPPRYTPSIYRVHAARRRHVPCHRRHHAQGPRRPSAQRHAQPAESRDHRDAARRQRQAACSRTSTASTPRASSGSATAHSGSATRTGRRWRTSRPKAA